MTSGSAQREAIRQISAIQGVPAGAVADLLRIQYPEALVTAKDIDNERQLARREALAQIITDQNAIAKIGSGLFTSQDEESFQRLLATLNEIREEHDIHLPVIVMTDMEIALKNAVETNFPMAQQQLCMAYDNNAKGHVGKVLKVKR
ncbi:hypothetical protein E4U19_003831 [Claviceps sp. Clav32 group G5]|nr:hypothetical protein E4U19_003831 [Claviceps sp. Clav32 group G5]